jgi:hypothetical protein
MMSDGPFCCVESEISPLAVTAHSSGDSKFSKLKFSNQWLNYDEYIQKAALHSYIYP